MKMMNRWFTRYLHGIQNGVENDPRAFIVRENDKRSEPTAYPDYPNPEATDVVLHLSAGSPQKGKLTTTPNGKQGTETLIDKLRSAGQADEADRLQWSLDLTPIHPHP